MLVRVWTVAALAATASCRPVFHCRDVDACNLLGDGTCEVNGYCSYPDAACPSGKRFHADAPAGIADECVDEAALDTGTADETGPPPACSTWEIKYDDEQPARITDIVPHPDGGYLLASTGDDDTSGPGRLLIRHIDAETGLDLEAPVEVGQTKAQNPQSYIRVPRITAAHDLLAVYSWIDLVGQDLRKQGPALIHLGLADHDVERDEIYPDDTPRALRRAVALDDATLVLAGNRWEEAWYTRVHVTGDGDEHTWTLEWAQDGGPVTADDETDAATAQGLVVLDAETALIGGTLHADTGAHTPWLRKIDLDSGATLDECMGSSGGVMALARNDAGEVFFGGFRTTGGLSQVWVGRVETVCLLDGFSKESAWDDYEGNGYNALGVPPESIKDAMTAVLPLPGDRVLFAGQSDAKPYVLVYRRDGKERTAGFLRDDKVVVTGVAFAAAPVPGAGDCFVVAGVADGKGWVRKLDVNALPSER